MFKKEINSVAILDLFHKIPINFQLHKLNYSNDIFNFINFLINKVYNPVAIDKAFDNVILNFRSVLLFLLGLIFNSFLRPLKTFQYLRITNGGGGEIAMVSNP